VCVSVTSNSSSVQIRSSMIASDPTLKVVTINRVMSEPGSTPASPKRCRIATTPEGMFNLVCRGSKQNSIHAYTIPCTGCQAPSVQQDDGVPPLYINSISPLSTPFSPSTINSNNVILRTSIPTTRSRIRCQDIMRSITRYPTSHFRVKGWFSVTMGSGQGERMGC
jgi:hypothetical protein